MTMLTRWRRDKPWMILRIWFIRGEVYLSVWLSTTGSHLHPHYFLISGDNFVSNLHKELKGEISSLGCKHGGMDILRVPAQETLYCFIGFIRGSLNRIDRLLKNTLK
jgi:hypothetical protein